MQCGISSNAIMPFHSCSPVQPGTGSQPFARGRCGTFARTRLPMWPSVSPATRLWSISPHPRVASYSASTIPGPQHRQHAVERAVGTANCTERSASAVPFAGILRDDRTVARLDDFDVHVGRCRAPAIVSVRRTVGFQPLPERVVCSCQRRGLFDEQIVDVHERVRHAPGDLVRCERSAEIPARRAPSGRSRRSVAGEVGLAVHVRHLEDAMRISRQQRPAAGGPAGRQRPVVAAAADRPARARRATAPRRRARSASAAS